MYISDFNYLKPGSLEEACRMLNEYPDSSVLAGGTDLLVEIKQGTRFCQNIVSLGNVQELKSLEEKGDELIIGAAVTHNEVSGSGIVRKFCSAIAEAAAKIGSDQIRNVGTIGGNLCTGASCCDMGPILIAINGKVEITSPNSQRTVLLKDFFSSHRKTAVGKNEIMTKIIVTRPGSNRRVCFEKFGLREAVSVSVVSVAGSMAVTDDICTKATIVLGAVAPTPKISEKANQALEGKSVTDLKNNPLLLDRIGEAAAQDCQPIDDIRGTGEYRRELVKVLTKRVILRAIDCF